MKLRFLYLTIFLGILALPVSGAQKQRIAVIDLKSTGIPVTTSQAITSMLRSQLIDSGLFTVVERSQMDAIMKEQGLQMTGCTDSSCAVQIGKLLSANKILIGDINRIGKTYVISCRVVNVEKGVAEFSTSVVATTEDKIHSSVSDLVYKLGKRVAGEVKARTFGKAPQGVYAGYQQVILMEGGLTSKGFADFYSTFYGGNLGYLYSFSQYLSVSCDAMFAYASNGVTSGSLTLAGLGAGARTGIFLHDKVYIYFGFSLQALMVNEKGPAETAWFGGIALQPLAGLNILFTKDVGMFLGAGYNTVFLFDKANSMDPSGLTVSGGVTYNAFGL